MTLDALGIAGKGYNVGVEVSGRLPPRRALFPRLDLSAAELNLVVLNASTLRSHFVALTLFAALVLGIGARASLYADAPLPPNAVGPSAQGVDAVVRNDDPDLRAGWTAADEGKEKSRDPLRRNAHGVQTYFPSVAKIVGRSFMTERDGEGPSVPYFYGSGSYVAEYRDWGIVVTNWHVVSESDASVDVVFPSGSYSAQVILRDEVWDMAALLIRKPANILPLPISHEAPRIGETFWVGGYGQSTGLNDFRMRSGELTTYVSLVDPKFNLDEYADPSFDDSQDSDGSNDADAKKRKAVNQEAAQRIPESAFSPLYETLSIKQGVRRGDSGGPIFNKYGELAGILWGSDGKCTMGSSCLRLQVFVTQALREAANICARDQLASDAANMRVDFLSGYFRKPDECAVAQKTDLAMQQAFEQEGVFPASTRKLYSSADGRSADSLALISQDSAYTLVERAADELNAKNGGVLPPYPPVFSPTFVCLQRNFKTNRPDVSDAKTFAALDAYALANARKERENEAIRQSRELWASVDETADRKLVSVTSNEDSDVRLTLAPVSNSVDAPQDAATPNAEPTASTENKENAAPAQAEANDDSKAPTADALADAKSAPPVDSEADPNAPETAPADGTSADAPAQREPLSVLKTYVLVIAVLAIFCVAMRFMQADVDSAGRKKKAKLRLQQKK